MRTSGGAKTPLMIAVTKSSRIALIPTKVRAHPRTIATPITGLRLGAAWDLLNVDTTYAVPGGKVEADIWSLAVYASFQATEKLSFHGRVEYVTGDIDEAYLNKIEQARNDASKVKTQAVSAIIDLYNN